ncbi:MAG: hypothetical protein HYW48_06545 [Deltaproteobacteria bacterium]|nr:hypothetical protein [Deltaproteobacteria bacterium]
MFRHGLPPQVPDRTWVMVPPSVRSTRKLYRILRTANDPTVGVEDHRTYRIAGIERSVVEALQYATKIGLQTAISATRRAIAEGLTTEKKQEALRYGEKTRCGERLAYCQTLNSSSNWRHYCRSPLISDN